MKGRFEMERKRRLSGEERRARIVQMLKDAKDPITGQVLAETTGVSRQVIVTDIALLKASDEPIIATNRGYLYMGKKRSTSLPKRIILCKHTPEQAEEELNALVDCGVTVENVIVEHPIYGELTGSLIIKSRYDVEQFMKTIEKKEATLLSVLTGGLHLHTIEAESVAQLDTACERLLELGILYQDDVN